MAITFPVSFPSTMIIERCSMVARSSVGMSMSPFTGNRQVQVHQGQWWEMEIKLALSNRSEIAATQAMLLSLNGSENTVLAGDPGAVTARGSAGTTPGTPLVNGAGQTGGTLLCKGAPNGASDYLLGGDYIQLGSGASSKLHQVLENVTSDGSGNFTLALWPNLRSSPGDNDVITMASPQGVFRLPFNFVSWSEITVSYDISFNLVEAL